MGGSDRPPGGESFGAVQEGVASGDLYLPLSKEVLGWGAFPEAYRCVLADTQTSPREGKGEAAPVMGVGMGRALIRATLRSLGDYWIWWSSG